MRKYNCISINKYRSTDRNKGSLTMAQFFNFKQDHYGLTESEVEKNIALYGFNTYTKNGKKDARFSGMTDAVYLEEVFEQID